MTKVINRDIGERREGFFWGGNYPYTDSHRDHDLASLADALHALAEGLEVHFIADW